MALVRYPPGTVLPPSQAQGRPPGPQHLQARAVAAVGSPADKLQEGRAARAGLEEANHRLHRRHSLCHPQRGEGSVPGAPNSEGEALGTWGTFGYHRTCGLAPSIRQDAAPPLQSCPNQEPGATFADTMSHMPAASGPLTV